VSEVVLVGGVGATTPALLSLLDSGTGLTFISSQGRLRGRLRPAEARNVELRRKQYAQAGSERFTREVSRAIVLGKLRNCRTLARRMARGQEADRIHDPLKGAGDTPRSGDTKEGDMDPAPEADDQALDAGLGARLERISAALGAAPGAKDVAELRGLEGAGSQAYFAVLRAALRPGLTFGPRTRRPPRDPVNALLSLAYGLLTNALFTAAEVAGLDAYAGFFHADKYGRPALALDLVEEFRPIVADSVVLTVVNNRMLTEADFETDAEGGVRLGRRALKLFLAQFSRRLATQVYHPAAGRALSYQKVFEVQARQLRQSIESGEPEYRPFLAK
jgi:CRISPR-associated protein Cas1